MKEWARKAPEFTKTPEFQESVAWNISAANKHITHADFAIGTQSGTLGFKCMSGELCQFIRGARRTVFNILVLLCMVAPIVFIPLWAWHERRWWFLTGIVASVLGSCIATRLIYNSQKQNSVGAFLLVASIACWLGFGIDSYSTFLALCALWGLMLFMIADNVERQYAMQSLIENPDVFEDAITRNKIMFVRKSARDR